MKKWLLISSIINISILLIPLSFEIEKKEKLKEVRIKNVLIAEKDKIASQKNDNPQKIKTNEKNVYKNQLETSTENVIYLQDEKNFDNNIEELKESINISDTENLNSVQEISIKEKLEEDIKLEKSVSEIKELGNIVKVSGESSEKEFSFSQDNLTSLESRPQETDNNILSNDLVKENSELNYKILNMPNPEYPSKAKNLNFNKKIIVVSEFIVGKDGKVRKFLLKSENELYKKYAFDKSIEKVLKEYRFTPINYKGRSVEVKFIKIFEFN